MRRLLPRSAALLAAAALSTTLAGCAVQQAQVPDRFALGRDAAGERCTANRTWNNGQVGAFDTAFLINCGGVAASRAQAIVTAQPAKSSADRAEVEADCGDAVQRSLAGVGDVTVRRCTDKALSAPAIVMTYLRDGTEYRGAAVATAVGPLERAFTAVVTADYSATDALSNTPQVAAASVPGAEVASAGLVSGGFLSDVLVPLREGTILNRQGRFVEASRVLNDALSRLPAGTAKNVETELLLEAGLADSNIRFEEAAKSHFGQARALLLANPDMPRAAVLERKRGAYAALDALNRRDYADVLSASEVDPRIGGTTSTFPLEDPLGLAQINEGSSRGEAISRLALAVSVPNTILIEQQVIAAQRNWARSVAMSSRPGGLDAATAELNSSAALVSSILNRPIDPLGFVYLVAQIERQGGRLEAQRAAGAAGDARGAAFRTAIARFECAESTLIGKRPASPDACVVQLNDAARARLTRAGAVTISPIIAETQMERAALRVASGDTSAAVRDAFDGAVDTLLASGRAGSLPPSGLEVYLGLLAKDATQNPGSPSAERFFRAVQAVGEPAIARQFSRIQSVVNTDPATAALSREREDLTREIPALRYQIEAADAATDPAGAERRAELEKRRGEKEARLQQVTAKLHELGALDAVDDTPATIAEIQQTLVPGEVYFKIADIRGSTFGAVIGKQSSTIYPIEAANRSLADLVEDVRVSIRRPGSRSIPVFDVKRAAALFALISGPAAAELRSARKIVYDPSGPMANLPLGVLVADLDSLKAYSAAVDKRPKDALVVNDYSMVAFLARSAEIATALSPRSFIDARHLAQSTAPQPFLGLGEHAPPQIAATAQIRMAPNCEISGAALSQIMLNGSNAPISAEKLTVAATALGVPNAPRITGLDFTDQKLENDPSLANYKVLHFATHGLPESRLGCADIPPALITTLAGPESDGFLSFEEVARLKLDANLVVLAACETSASASLETGRRAGQEETGRSLDGLVRAFLAAKARAVLATQWRVSIGQESDQFMSALYTAGRTATIGNSLRTAQETLIETKRYSHPYFWGAYFLVGDASKTMLSNKVAVQGAGVTRAAR